MFCPNDSIEMKQIAVESHYENTVILDQCPKCGGLWFDYFELYQTKPGQSENVEKLSIDTLVAPVELKKRDLLCPRDNTRLVYFSDPLFPTDIIIARCPSCKGFWLNRGEFTKYDKFRRSLKSPGKITPADANLQKRVMEIMAAQGKDDSLIVSDSLWNFLGTSNLAFRVLITLLRFFIKV